MDGLPSTRSRSSPRLAIVALAAAGLVASMSGSARAGGCPVDPDRAWTTAEAWAFERVCMGEVVDLRAGPSGTGTTLSGRFVSQVLLTAPWSTAVPKDGVHIRGATISEGIDLSWAKVPAPLALVACHVQGPVKLDGSEVASLKLSDSILDGPLRLESVVVRQGVVMPGLEAPSAQLGGARIGHVLDVRGASIAGEADLTGVRVDADLRLDGDASFQELVLSSAWIGGRILLGDVMVDGTLQADGLLADGPVILDRDADLGELDLSGARIQGDLVVGNVKVSGRLDLTRADIRGDATLTPQNGFRDVILRGARVRGMLVLDGSRLAGGLDLRSTRVEGHLRIAEVSIATWADLSGARIGGDVDIDATTVSGPLAMDGLAATGTVMLTDGQFRRGVTMRGTDAGRGIDLSGSRFDETVDLSGTDAGEALIVGRRGAAATAWGKEATLVLRDVNADALGDTASSWPRAGVDLEGFRYGRMGSSREADAHDMAGRESSWFEHWLRLHKSGSPGPWTQAAQVLESTGYPDKAREVRYALADREGGRHWEREEWGLWLVSSLSGALVGHGHRPERAGIWALFAVLLGAILLVAGGRFRDPEAPLSEWGSVSRFRGELRRSLGRALVESLDELLPGFRLRRGETWAPYGGWLAGWVYTHRLFGLLLTLLVIGSVAGWIGN